MPLDPSIPLQVRTPELMSPAQAMSLQALARQNQMQGMEMVQARRQMQEQQAANAITQQPGAVDPQTGLMSPQTLSQLAQVSPSYYQRIIPQQIQMRTTLANIGKAQNEAYTKLRDDFYQQAGPELISNYDATVKASGAEGGRQAFYGTMRERLDALRKSGRYAPAEIDRLEQEAMQFRPESFQLFYKHVNPQYASEQAKATAPTNFERELQAAGYKPGTPEYQRQLQKRISRETAPTQTMISLTGAGQPSGDALTFAVDQYLAGDPTAAQGYARSAQMKAAFQNRLAERAKEKGISGADLAAKTAEYQGIKAGQRTLGTRQAQIDMSVTEAQNVMPIALEASNKVDRTKYPTLNSMLLAAEKGTGGEDVVRLAGATNALINIYSRAISPTGTPTVSDKDHAREILSTAYSKGQYAAAVELMRQEMQAAKSAPGQVREDLSRSTSGRAKEGGYVEIRTTTSGKRLGKKADGTIEEIK